MIDQNTISSKTKEAPTWVSGQQPAVSAGSVIVEKEEPTRWEIDRIKYQEGRSQLRHLNYAFYLTLSFFVAITGWFLTFGANRPYLALTIGSLFLFLSLVQAKNTRLYEDNLKLVKKLERAYKSKTRYKSTGIAGAGNFISFIILSALTSYFLLYPYSYRLSYHSIGVAMRFLVLSLPIFIVSYYILGDGKFGKAFFSKFKLTKWLVTALNRKTRIVQAWCYAVIFSMLGIYWYITWF